MRIGIYGGAFNPPHIGHLKVAAHALVMGNLDSVWLLPAFHHAFGKDMAPFDDRLEMVRRMVGTDPGTRVLNHAVGQPHERDFGTTYTVDLIEKLQSPFHELVLILGPDQLATTDKWHRWDDLKKMVEILVVPECGPERSTKVRAAIKAGDTATVEAMVPPAVRAWIMDKKLYV